MINDDNAVSRIAQAVADARRRTSSRSPTPRPSTRCSTAITELTGLEFPEEDLESAVAKIGPVSRIVNATLRNTANPTMLKAGYKANVIPSTAEATVDCRVLPGSRGAPSGRRSPGSSATASRSTGSGNRRWSSRSRATWSTR